MSSDITSGKIEIKENDRENVKNEECTIEY